LIDYAQQDLSTVIKIPPLRHAMALSKAKGLISLLTPIKKY
jgi:hypothetical protein